MPIVCHWIHNKQHSTYDFNDSSKSIRYRITVKNNEIILTRKTPRTLFIMNHIWTSAVNGRFKAIHEMMQQVEQEVHNDKKKIRLHTTINVPTAQKLNGAGI